MYPYCVTSKIRGVELFPLKDGRFQTIKKENLSPFMEGFGYILIEDRLAVFIELLNIEGIILKDAVIWERSLNKEHHNYKQLLIKKKITPENLKELDSKSLQMYVFNETYLFISPQLKEALENAGFDYLSFSLDFSEFAL